MSVLFTFERAAEQRRVFIAIFSPGNGAYCVWSQGTVSGTFQWSLVARDPWPHGITFSRSAEICPYQKSLKNQNLTSELRVGFVFLPWRGREGTCLFLPGSLLVARGWVAPMCPQPGSWSSEQVEQGRHFCCVQDTACCEGETQEVCNLWAGVACVWVQGSKQLRGDDQQDIDTPHKPLLSYVPTTIKGLLIFFTALADKDNLSLRVIWQLSRPFNEGAASWVVSWQLLAAVMQSLKELRALCLPCLPQIPLEGVFLVGHWCILKDIGKNVL